MEIRIWSCHVLSKPKSIVIVAKMMITPSDFEDLWTPRNDKVTWVTLGVRISNFSVEEKNRSYSTATNENYGQEIMKL